MKSTIRLKLINLMINLLNNNKTNNFTMMVYTIMGNDSLNIKMMVIIMKMSKYK